MNEKAVASHILLDGARRGLILLRNNSGFLFNEKGQPVRFGLGSYEEKHQLKSSDYIGITPVFITPDMVGQVIGVFTAVETKPEGWRFTNGDKRALHQKNFIDMVLAAGGYAGFAQSVTDFRKIIRHDP